MRISIAGCGVAHGFSSKAGHARAVNSPPVLGRYLSFLIAEGRTIKLSRVERGGTDAGSLLVQCRHAFLPLDFVLGGHVHSLENTRSPEVKARIFAAGMPKDV
jgi:hypothetical protein